MNKGELGYSPEEGGAPAAGSGRRSQAGLTPAKAIDASDRHGTLGNPVDELLRSKTSRERWTILMRLVHAEFPHCIMYGVNIADGMIISCESLQRSLLFGPSLVMRDDAEPIFDPNWQELEALCKRMGTGQLAELRFSNSHPIRGKTAPRGRRFR